MSICLFKERVLCLHRSLTAQICECLQPNDRYSYENGLSLVWQKVTILKRKYIMQHLMDDAFECLQEIGRLIYKLQSAPAFVNEIL